jgi:hypothetical protein
MTPAALGDWDDFECDLTHNYSGSFEHFDHHLLSEYSSLCKKIYESGSVTVFEAKVKAWAHLIRAELDSAR